MIVVGPTCDRVVTVVDSVSICDLSKRGIVVQCRATVVGRRRMVVLWSVTSNGRLDDHPPPPPRRYRSWQSRWCRHQVAARVSSPWPVIVSRWPVVNLSYILTAQVESRQVLSTPSAVSDVVIVILLFDAFTTHYDVGPTSNRHWVNVSCLLGSPFLSS